MSYFRHRTILYHYLHKTRYFIKLPLKWNIIQIQYTCINSWVLHTAFIARAGYRFTKGLTQNLNLRTNLKLEYDIKSLNYIQQNYIFQAWFLLYWTMTFTFWHAQWFKSYQERKWLRNLTFCVSALVKRFPGEYCMCQKSCCQIEIDHL